MNGQYDIVSQAQKVLEDYQKRTKKAFGRSKRRRITWRITLALLSVTLTFMAVWLISSLN